MKLFIKILAGVAVAVVGALIWLVFNSTDEVVRLTNYIKTMPARNARHNKDEAVIEESNPSDTKPGNEGGNDQPVIDQQTVKNSTDEEVH